MKAIYIVIIFILLSSCAANIELDRLNTLNVNLENSIQTATNKAASNKLKAIKNQIQYKIDHLKK